MDDLSKVTKPSCKRRYREYWECHVHTEYAKSKVGHNKLRSYNKFKKIFKTEPYLVNQSLYKYQKILAKFRLSTHRLRIETARYNSKNNYVPPPGGTRDIYWWGCALAHQKKGVLGAGQVKKRGVFTAAHTYTEHICEYPPPPSPGYHQKIDYVLTAIYIKLKMRNIF